MSKKKKEFPKTLFVTLEKDGKDSFTLSNESLENLNVDGGRVAIYKLVDVGTLRIGKVFESDPDPRVKGPK